MLNKLQKLLIENKKENSKFTDYKLARKELDRRKGCKYPIVDCNVHITDFVQQTYSLKDLLYYMDKTNIKKAVISGFGMTKMHFHKERVAPEYYLDDDSPCYYYSHSDSTVAEEYKKLTKKEQERFYPVICGFNPTDKYAIKHVESIFKMYPGVFRGFGELLFRHDDLTLMTYGNPARPNDPAMFPIYDFAAKYNLPITIHQNISSVGTSSYPKYLHEFEEVLRKFPKTKFLFTHCGVSRRINAPNYVKMISRLLDQYPMLNVDFTWFMYEEIICKNGIIEKDWLQFSEKYSDRICIGSDNVGNYANIGVENSKFNTLLDMLSENARKNISYRTVEKLYKNTLNRVETNTGLEYPSLEN